MNDRLTLTIAWTWTALALGFWPTVIAVAASHGVVNQENEQM